MNNTLYSKTKSRNRQLRELGTIHHLTFSSQELLGNKLIGLDGRNRKLIIIEKGETTNRSYVVDLENITGFTVKKTYQNIRNGELKHKKIEDFLISISLILDVNNGQEQLVLPFYERNSNQTSEISARELRAEKWQQMLSKIINQNKQRA